MSDMTEARVQAAASALHSAFQDPDPMSEDYLDFARRTLEAADEVDGRISIKVAATFVRFLVVVVACVAFLAGLWFGALIA